MLIPDVTSQGVLVGNADDVAAIISVRTPRSGPIVAKQVTIQMTNHGLKLAVAETKIIMLTRGRIPTIRMITNVEDPLGSMTQGFPSTLC